MTTFEPHAASARRPPRRATRWIGLGSATLLAVTATALAVPPAASADPTTSARNGSFTITGGGYGHGLGMSQYGAYGAARRGLQHEQILAFYYPGTKITTQKPSSIRVWITSDTDSDLRVLPAAGLRVADGAGKSKTLPTGSAYRAWRITRSGAGYRLAHKTASGAWRTTSTGLGTSTWRFTGASLIKVALPGGKARNYRGSVALIKYGSRARSVNSVSLEHYVQAVVPAEMPTSWHIEAVKTQAVAARSYAVMLRGHNRSDRGYDICDTTACQVYRGADYETRNGLTATRGTAGQILTYKGAVALTMFASSNGGWRKTGSYPYLRAGADPYDSVIKSQAWSRKITTAQLRRAYPSAGTITKIKITSRDGHGKWGGRVSWMRLIGSKKTITVTGGAFQRKFGMRSNYFTVNGTSGGGTPTPPPTPVVEPVVTTTPVQPGRAYATYPRSYDGASRVDVAVVRSSGALVRYPVAGGRLGTARTLAGDMDAYAQVVSAGDWNGDRYADVVARTSSGRLVLARGTAAGGLLPAISLGASRAYTSVTGVGDVNRDGRPDLVAQTKSGRAYLLLGNGKTGLTSQGRLAGSWTQRDWVRGVGDFDRDGRVDVVVRRGSTLYLLRGTGSGFAKGVSLGRSSKGLAAITGVGDVDGDARADLLARSTSGQLLLLRGDGRRALAAPTAISSSFGGTRFAS